MFSIFKREMRANVKPLFFWNVGMFFMVAASMMKFQAGDEMSAVYDKFPKIIKVLMGSGDLNIGTLEGYYGMLFTFLLLIGCTQAALLGAGIISKEERDKTSEFLFNKPITRKNIVISKMLASIVNIFIVAVVSWLSSLMFTASLNPQEKVISYVHILGLGLFITQLAFLSIGFIISAIIGNNKKASAISGNTVLAMYIATVVINMFESFSIINILVPFKYFEPYTVYNNGINYWNILASFGIMICGYFVTTSMYAKRDLKS